jgi:nitroreductase
VIRVFRLTNAMNVLEAVKGRRSIRDFHDRPVAHEAIDDLIEALRWAPSAGNLQSRKFYLVFNEDKRRRLAAAAGNKDLAARLKKAVKAALGKNALTSAPLVVVACLDRGIHARYGERGERLYAIQDVAASLMNMMLVAHDQGLGTVWIGAFDEQEVAEVLGLPEHLRPVALVPVGYPARVPAPPPRVSPEQVAEFVR